MLPTSQESRTRQVRKGHETLLPASRKIKPPGEKKKTLKNTAIGSTHPAPRAKLPRESDRRSPRTAAADPARSDLAQSRKRNRLPTRAALIGHELSANVRACGVTSAGPAILFPGAVGGRDRAPRPPALAALRPESSRRRRRRRLVSAPGARGPCVGVSVAVPSPGWGTSAAGSLPRRPSME